MLSCMRKARSRNRSLCLGQTTGCFSGREDILQTWISLRKFAWLGIVCTEPRRRRGEEIRAVPQSNARSARLDRRKTLVSSTFIYIIHLPLFISYKSDFFPYSFGFS